MAGPRDVTEPDTISRLGYHIPPLKTTVSSPSPKPKVLSEVAEKSMPSDHARPEITLVQLMKQHGAGSPSASITTQQPETTAQPEIASPDCSDWNTPTSSR